MRVWISPCVAGAKAAAVLVWVVCSRLGLVLRRCTQRAMPTRTLWIDKLCIDQSSEESKTAGVVSFASKQGRWRLPSSPPCCLALGTSPGGAERV